MERRLTAILATDVIGYSRLMGQDEAGTFDALNAHRREFIARTAGERLLKFAPDFTISNLVRADYWRPPLMEVVVAGLRKAGLPE